MNPKQATVKAKLMKRYSAELDKLLEKSKDTEDFGALEKQVNELAEGILPETLSEVQSSKDFSPSVPSVSGKGEK